MRFSVGTNFDNNLLPGIKDTNTVNVFGKMSHDIVGGGRPTISLPEVGAKQVAEHVSLAHFLGLEFNYLLNSTCMDNLEFTEGTNRRIFEMVDWLRSIKADWVTVSLPFFIDIFKKRAPEIKISLSTFTYVDTLQKAKQFENMGVDEITLPEGLNRNFPLLKLFRKNLSCDIQLIATNTCIGVCPHRNAHANFQSHASQTEHVSQGFALDYCMLKCTQLTVKNPVEILKAQWIRPEDLHYYEEIGIDKFKITERMKKTEAIISVVNAYDKRKYDGDLGRLLNFKIKADYIRPNNKLLQISQNKGAFNLQECRDLMFARNIRIDNRALDGFMEFFAKSDRDCRNMLCGEECRYCHGYAEKVLNSDKDYDRILLKRFDMIFEKLNSGLFYSAENPAIKWPGEVRTLFDRMLEIKPEHFRETAGISIHMRAEENARARNSDEVSIGDLVRANYFDTPEEFREYMVESLETSLGITVRDYMEDSAQIKEEN